MILISTWNKNDEQLRDENGEDPVETVCGILSEVIARRCSDETSKK